MSRALLQMGGRRIIGRYAAVLSWAMVTIRAANSHTGLFSRVPRPLKTMPANFMSQFDFSGIFVDSNAARSSSAKMRQIMSILFALDDPALIAGLILGAEQPVGAALLDGRGVNIAVASPD